MLNQLDVLTRRVGDSNERIDLWLTARRKLLVAYYHTVGIRPNKELRIAVDDKTLDKFCQSLVDYLSTGHFSIYAHMIEELDNDNPLHKAALICSALQANTALIMEVYDTHFEMALAHDNPVEFQQALSFVGEALETRFTLEDSLIQLAVEKHLTPLPIANDTMPDKQISPD